MNALRLRHAFSILAVVTTALAATPVHAGPYSALFVFGDSVSDSGNVALAIGAPGGVSQTVTGNTYIPDLPYAPFGTFSNGPVWAQSFAGMLALSAAPSLAGGSNFAWAGARTGGPNVPVPTVTTQAGMYLAGTGGVASADALYVVAEVGNDARDALKAIAGGADPAAAMQSAAITYASNVGSIVDGLRGAGARHFLVFDNVNLGLVPVITAMGTDVSGLASLLTWTMNQALLTELAGDAGVTIFDTYSFLTQVVQSPSAFGYTNAHDACGAAVAADCSGYVFWDGLHPTAALHQQIAEAAFAAAVPESSTLALLAAGLLVLARHARPRLGRNS